MIDNAVHVWPSGAKNGRGMLSIFHWLNFSPPPPPPLSVVLFRSVEHTKCRSAGTWSASDFHRFFFSQVVTCHSFHSGQVLFAFRNISPHDWRPSVATSRPFRHFFSKVPTDFFNWIGRNYFKVSSYRHVFYPFCNANQKTRSNPLKKKKKKKNSDVASFE